MTDLIERLHIAAKIHKDIGGQSALAATIREAATALEAAREEIAAHERNDVGYIDTIDRQARERDAALEGAGRWERKYRHAISLIDAAANDDAERLAEARDALRQCWLLSGADPTHEPTDIAKAAIQGVKDLRSDYDDPAEAERVTKLESDYAALLAEHEALLRRVAEAPVAEVNWDHGADAYLSFEGGPDEMSGCRWNAHMSEKLDGQRVRILAEPGEVG